MRWALIVGGVVTNVVEQATQPTVDLGGQWVADPAGRAGPGWAWDGAFHGPSDPPPVPSEVTMRQARLALLAAGKLSAVDTAIAALAEPAQSAARIWWEYSNTLERRAPLVQQLGAALGLSDAQIDALFVTATTL